MPSFRSDGFELAYDDIRPSQDEAGVVVLVHGFATSAEENWRRLGWYGAFERKGYRTIGFDLRGHGRSDKPHEAAAYDRTHMAGDIIRLMDHLEVGYAELMGYSLGAHLAASAAGDQPERFGHLILGGVGQRWIAPAPGGEAPAMSMAEAMRTADPAAIIDPILKGFRQFAEIEGADRLALAACSEGRGGRPSGDLANLAMPVLVVAGARDEIAGDAAGLAQTIAGARAVSLPGCDHFSAIPHALFKAAVFDFLDGWLD